MNIANSIKCVDPNHNLTYVLDFVDRTHLGCIYEKIVIGCTAQNSTLIKVEETFYKRNTWLFVVT